MSASNHPDKFIPIVNIVLGALAGLLISGPAMSETASPLRNLFVTAAFAILGTFAGYKRRESRAFMYLSLICVLVLSSLMLRAFTQIQQ